MDDRPNAPKHVKDGLCGAALGVGGILLAVACCGGVPLLIVLAASIGVAGVIGGVVAVAVVAGLGVALFTLRGAQRRKAALQAPSERAAWHRGES